MVVPITDNLTTQSSTLATIPSSTTVATDDVSGVHFQKVKIFDGTADSTYGLVVDSGGRTTVKLHDGTTAVSVNSGNNALYVDPRPKAAQQKQDSSGLTTASTAYSMGDVLGAGWTFTSMARASGGTGRLTGVAMIDKGDVVSVIDLYVADSSITFGTDNSAPSVSDSDAEKLIAKIALTFDDLGGVRFASSDSLATAYECSGGTSLYVYAVTRSANAVFAAATDLRLRLAYQQD